MSDRERRQQQRRSEEDAVFNRMLCWVAAAIVAELIIVIVNKLFVDMILGVDVANALLQIFKVFTYLGVVLAVACVVWIWKTHKDKKPLRLPCILLLADICLWLLSIMSYFFYNYGLDVLAFIPPAAAVLILVYFLYQRTFFYSALVNAGGLLTLWIYHSYGGEFFGVRAGYVLSFILLVAAVVLTFLVSKGNGKLNGVRFMPEGTLYPVIYLSCALTAIALILAVALGSGAALYLFFALAAWVFIQAVFFTVKLM